MVSVLGFLFLAGGVVFLMYARAGAEVRTAAERELAAAAPARRQTAGKPWGLLVIFGPLGLPLIVTGCVWGFQQFTLYREGDTVQGRIVQTQGSDRRGGASYPVVEFTTSDGAKYRFTEISGLFNVTEPRIGETVKVLYQRENPSDAHVLNFKLFWLDPLVVCLIGCVILAFGFGGYLLRPRVKDKEMDQSPRHDDDGRVIELREPREAWKANIFWGLAFGLPLILSSFFASPETSSLQKYGLMAAGLAWMGFTGFSALGNFRRKVRCDNMSIEVSQAFGSKRILLSDVKKVTGVDVGQKLKIVVGEKRAGTMDSAFYVLRDAQGEELLQLDKNMEPAGEMRRLLERLKNLTSGSITDE